MYFDQQIIGNMLHQLFINIKSLQYVEHPLFLDEIKDMGPQTHLTVTVDLNSKTA